MPEAQKKSGLSNSGRRGNWVFEIRSTSRDFPNYARLVKHERATAPQSITEVLFAQRSEQERRRLAARLLEERRLARKLAIDESPYGEAEEQRVSHAKTVALTVVSRRDSSTVGHGGEETRQEV